MKVCVFTSVHRPYDVRVFHRECRTLAGAGHQVVLLAHADFDREEKFGVLVKGVSRPRNRFLRLLNGFRFLKKCLDEKADVYHFHDLELLPVGFLLKLVTRKKVIYDCHENYPEAVYERAWLPAWSKKLLSRFIAWAEPLLARRLDCVICVVPDQQQRFQSRRCKTELVRNLPRLELFEEAREENPEPENRIIYVGGLTMVRGARFMVDIMVELQKTHPDTRLLWLGPFNEPYVEAEVKDYIRERGVEDSIEHIHFVPHQEVPDYIVRSRVGLIPWQPNQQTLKMVFPNKVFEYMSCGVPTVASNLPSLKFIFDKAKSGIVVDSGDAEAHAAAIAKLLDDPKLAEELGKNGLLFVKENHNWETEAARLIALYNSFGDRS